MNKELMAILDDDGHRTVQEQHDEIMQLFSEQPQWISVEDESVDLPNYVTPVLIKWSGDKASGHKINSGYLTSRKCAFVGVKGLMIVPEYWQPLPELPEDA